MFTAWGMIDAWQHDDDPGDLGSCSIMIRQHNADEGVFITMKAAPAAVLLSSWPAVLCFSMPGQQNLV